jgi:hypothetical protein
MATNILVAPIQPRLCKIAHFSIDRPAVVGEFGAAEQSSGPSNDLSLAPPVR